MKGSLNAGAGPKKPDAPTRWFLSLRVVVARTMLWKNKKPVGRLGGGLGVEAPLAWGRLRHGRGKRGVRASPGIPT